MAGRASDPFFLREDGPGLLDGGGVGAFWAESSSSGSGA
jgi:hypothetical protein